MKVCKRIALLSLWCSFSFLLCDRDAKGAEVKIPLSKILVNDHIEALSHWSFNKDVFLVVVTSYVKKFEEEQLTGRKLTIYKKQSSGLLKIFDFDAEMDHFLAMFPVGDGSNNLMTIWISGSAFHFNIFSISKGKVTLVLEVGSHNFPEFVDIDNDGKQEILISEGAFLSGPDKKKTLGYPEKTNIYKWDGRSYLLINTVSWKTRLDTLQGE